MTQKSSFPYHKIDCKCSFCKSKRGELKGSNHPCYVPKKIRICKCGCKETFKCYPSSKRIFINFHQHRGKFNGFYKKHHTKKTIEGNRDKNRIIQSGTGNGMWGKHHKISTIEKLRSYIGDKTANWQGGKSFEKYTRLWNKQLKEIIRVRDLFNCRLCGRSEISLKKRLSVHHIDYNKKNCKESNLISLCHSCHSKTSAGNRKRWIKYFKEVI